MNTKRTILFLVIVAVLVTGCVAVPTANNAETTIVNKQQEVYGRSQPIPIYDYSPERDLMIQLYNIRMSTVSTWTVICSNMGNCLDSCPSLGYPIPADVQLTNPLGGSIYNPPGIEWSTIVVEQPEPNGLFSSKNTAGTWVMCIAENGNVYPVYTELNATSYPYPVHVENGLIVADQGKVPSIIIDTSKLKSGGAPTTPTLPAP